MLFMQKTTKDRRFTVSITPDTPEASMLLRSDSARSLKELSDVLIEASQCALEAAVGILEAGKSPATAGAVDPQYGIVTE